MQHSDYELKAMADGIYRKQRIEGNNSVKVENTESGVLKITVHCALQGCGKNSTIFVTNDEMFNYLINDELLQVAMPEVDPNHRESLMMGLCLDCVGSIYAVLGD